MEAPLSQPQGGPVPSDFVPKTRYDPTSTWVTKENFIAARYMDGKFARGFKANPRGFAIRSDQRGKPHPIMGRKKKMRFP